MTRHLTLLAPDEVRPGDPLPEGRTVTAVDVTDAGTTIAYTRRDGTTASRWLRRDTAGREVTVWVAVGDERCGCSRCHGVDP